MVDRIVKEFRPLRVILFGSWARGTANEWGDVDLLVVFPALEDKREMAINIMQSLSGLSVSKDILVSTPDEISVRGRIVGTVLNSALCEGRVLFDTESSESLCSEHRTGISRSVSNLDSTEQSISEHSVRKNRIAEGQLWLRFSEEDLAWAVHGLTEDASRPQHVCWNAQQATEKVLKAALLIEGKKSPFSHDLDELLKHLPDTWPVRHVRIDLASLTQWAVEGRYLGERKEATPRDAEQAVALARRIHDSVKAEFERRLGDASPSE